MRANQTGKGLTTFQLKWLALLFMVIDHTGMYFGMPYGLYLLCRSVGRLSYPLFLFCMTIGYRRTRNRRAYLLRLYLGSLFMTGFGLAMDALIPSESGYGNHNIFLSMLLVGLVVSTVEAFQRDQRRGLRMAGALFAVQVLYMLVQACVPLARQVSGDTLTGIIPNLALNEYGLDFVILGVLMYFLQERRDVFTVMYLLFSIAQFSAEALYGELPIQWLMVLSLPLMLRYNGERGKSWKYFFYLFYPAHTALLFYLSTLLS